MVRPYLAQQPVDDFGMLFSDLKYSATLAAATDTTLTIPGNAGRYKAVMKVELNGVVWVALNATATVPAGASFAATNSELITDDRALCREVKAGDVLHFISTPAGTDVSVVLYALGTNN